ncbi:FCS-Like Zinc finger 15-like [Lotus japonicus]|uniref:FCS-Like Zinc finger 15-like n=1 Tax=Lotus japonicus TaxID=34305 RepID=UPI0025909115|nr:FCS-Like Zinc finger 15-like [Lotus japonicus]
MVGLSVVLEPHNNHNHKGTTSTSTSKTTNMFGSSINKPSPSPSPSPVSPPSSTVFFASSTTTTHHTTLFQPPTFLDQCFLCRNKLLPGKDIYMYKGDRAFCSVDCRCEHILTDEEESVQKEKGRHQRKGKNN